MTDDQPNEPVRPVSTENPVVSESPSATAAASPLTAEEQMALFEKDLKENDWGHQPC